MIFDPKQGVDSPPPQPPNLPQKLQKVGVKWGGLGGFGSKTHWGICLLDKVTILQGVNLSIQPLGVAYANRPKKAQNGGYVVFPPKFACLALIWQCLRGDSQVSLNSLRNNNFGAFGGPMAPAT